MDARRIPRCGGVLRGQRLLDHFTDDRRASCTRSGRPPDVLDPSGTSIVAGTVRDVACRGNCGGHVCHGFGPRLSARRHSVTSLRVQLVADLVRGNAVLCGERSPCVAPPLVTCGGGAVVPRLAGCFRSVGEVAPSRFSHDYGLAWCGVDGGNGAVVAARF